jgi:alpha-amylase
MKKFLLRLFIFLFILSTNFTNLIANNYVFATGSGDIAALGTIFHAFGWPICTIIKHLPKIHAAHFTTILLSPLQPQKSIPEIDNRRFTGWWAFYQPLDFKIGNTLGSEPDLIDLCARAHRSGIKIIADVVLNHVANDGGGDELTRDMFESQEDFEVLHALHISKQVHQRLLRPDFYHPFCGDAGTTTDRFTQTHGQLGGLPDLNTANLELQQIIINFIITLIDCGVDGFRLDAAIHIELPVEFDGSSGSNFWLVFTQAIIDKSIKVGRQITLIGECAVEINERIRHYLEFMNLTDSRAGALVRAAIYSKQAALAQFLAAYDKSRFLCVVESHDDYTSGTSSSMLPEDLILGWAIIAAYPGAACLFLARPILGVEGGLLDGPIPGELPLWNDPTITAINKFHKLMGQDPYHSHIMYACVLIVERGPEGNAEGAIIVNLGDQDLILDRKIGLQNNEYIDQITGYKFKVSKHYFIADDSRLITIKGRNVLVLIPTDKTEQRVVCSRAGGQIMGQVWVRLQSFGPTTYTTYSINEEGAISFANGKVIELGGDEVQIGKEIQLTLRCGGHLTKTYIFTKVKTMPRNVIFTKHHGWGTTTNEDGDGVPVPAWPGPCIYVYDKAGAYTKENARWDNAPEMTRDPVSGFFEYSVPSDFNGDVRVIFINGPLQLPCKMEEGFLLRCGENGIFENGMWTTTESQPALSLRFGAIIQNKLQYLHSLVTPGDDAS